MLCKENLKKNKKNIKSNNCTQSLAISNAIKQHTKGSNCIVILW